MNEGTFTEGYVLGRDSNGANNDSWSGGSWIVLIILFAIIFGWGRGGYGFGGNGGGETTVNVDSAVQRGFDTQGINSKLNDIGNGLCDGFYAMNTSMLNGFNGVQQTLCQGFGGVNTALVQQGYETRLGINGIQSQLASCCCDLGNQISQVNYNMAMNTNALQQAMCLNTRDIIDAQREGTNAILGFLTNEKITTLNTQLAQAQMQLSQAQQSTTFTNLANNLANNIINTIRPCPQPAYVVPNPNCCTNPCGNTCM